jgi:hypothetical protein
MWCSHIRWHKNEIVSDSQAWMRFLQCMHAMIIRHVYIYWRRSLTWTRNCRLCFWISHRFYRFCSIATISCRNSVRVEIVSIHNNFHRLTSNFERLMHESQMMMQNEHADSKQMQIRRRNEHADSQYELIDWQIQRHESRQLRQMMKIEKMKNQNDNYIRIEHESRNMHKKIALIMLNIFHADHLM